jgi:NAD(P)H-nitrite reductase large subunit
VLRRADDAAAIRRWVQEHGAREAIVLGGGVLGVEAADALARLGLRVVLLHRGSHLMNRQIDGPGGRLLADFLSARGIETRTRIAVEGIRLQGRRIAVAAAGGASFAADLCVASIGIRPNVALAEGAGLAVRHGIVVNRRMRSSDPYIFAAGDVAEVEGGASGLWPVGAAQGETAARNALGEGGTYAPQDPPLKLKCDGIDVFSFGNIEGVAGAEVSAFVEGGIARRVVKLGARIVGACSVGQPGSSKALAAEIQRQASG